MPAGAKLAPPHVRHYYYRMEEARTITLEDGLTMGYRLSQAPSNPSRRLIVLLHGMASNLTR